MPIRVTRLLAAALAVILVLGAAAEAQSPQGASSGAPTEASASGASAPEIGPETAKRLIETIEDPAERQRLVEDLRALSRAGAGGAGGAAADEDGVLEGLGSSLLGRISARIDALGDRLQDAVAAVAALPRLFTRLIDAAGQPEVLRQWADMALKVIGVLAAGIVASRLLHWGLRRPRRAIEARPADKIWQRALQLLGRALLELVPIAAFTAAAYAVLPFLDTERTGRLVALTLVNATVAVRVVLVLARLVLVPHARSLRLLPLRDEASAYLYVWVARLATLGIYGGFALEAARLLGVPPVLGEALAKLLGLAIAAVAAVLVMQNRVVVAEFLRGRYRAAPAERPSAGRGRRFGRVLNGSMAPLGMLKRLAGWWHYMAFVLIVALYGSWALEISGGFEFLAQAVLVTLAAYLAAGIVNQALQLGIGRWSRLSDDLKARYPDLESRANRYLPIVRKGATLIVYLLATFVALEAWGLGTWSWLVSDEGAVVAGEIGTILLIVALAFGIWEMVSAYIERTLEREAAQGEKGSQRKLTLLPLFKNVVRIALAVIATMIVLSEIGLDIGPLLAGVGVLGLAVGFGAQALVQDVITGVFMLIEDAISVGDWVDAGGHSGTVEALSIRTVKLRDLSGTVHIIPFSDVTTVSNYNRNYGYAVIDAGIAYRETYGDVVAELQAVADEMRDDDDWRPHLIGELEVFGLNNLGDSAVEVRVRLRTRPMKQFGVRREFLRRMKDRFDAAGIEIPFPHRTIWFGVDKDGTAPPARLADASRRRDPDDLDRRQRDHGREPDREPEPASADPHTGRDLPEEE